MNNKLDVFKILSEKENNNNLDIFEVMNSKQDQEHKSAPDFDLFNTKENLDQDLSGFQFVQEHEKSKTGSHIPGKALKFGIVLLVIIALMSLFIGFVKVPDDSMEPFISSGERVVIIKNVKTCKNGDIVVFKDSSGQNRFARIVASSGDVVDITAKKGLLVNNKESEFDEYAVGTTKAGSYTGYPLIVNEDEFFVLGDNREISVDSRSRSIGLLNESDIKGEVIYSLKSIK